MFFVSSSSVLAPDLGDPILNLFWSFPGLNPRHLLPQVFPSLLTSLYWAFSISFLSLLSSNQSYLHFSFESCNNHRKWLIFTEGKTGNLPEMPISVKLGLGFVLGLLFALSAPHPDKSPHLEAVPPNFLAQVL